MTLFRRSKTKRPAGRHRRDQRASLTAARVFRRGRTAGDPVADASRANSAAVALGEATSLTVARHR